MSTRDQLCYPIKLHHRKLATGLLHGEIKNKTFMVLDVLLLGNNDNSSKYSVMYDKQLYQRTSKSN